RCAAFGDIKAWKHAAVGQNLSTVGGGGSFEECAASRFSHGERQIFGAQKRLVFEDHAALDGVLELANIAGPIVTENKTAGFVGHASNRFLESAVVALDEEVD